MSPEAKALFQHESECEICDARIPRYCSDHDRLTLAMIDRVFRFVDTED